MPIRGVARGAVRGQADVPDGRGIAERLLRLARATAPSRRAQEDARLLEEARSVFQTGRGTYGYRRVQAGVKRTMPCGRDRIARLMRQDGLRGKTRRRFVTTTQSQHDRPVAPNLLGQAFSAEAANRKWVADITFIGTGEGWRDLATVEDLFSRAIVGWAMESHMTDWLTRQALDMARRRRQPAQDLLHHSDRGGQYASAVQESFFSRLKTELLHGRTFATRAIAYRNGYGRREVAILGGSTGG